MNDSQQSKQIIHAENVTIGDSSSRISSVIFALLCVVPLFSTVLFGAVDNITWGFLSILFFAIVLLWLAEAWKAKGLLINTDAIQLPLLALLSIGIVQLLPLNSATGDLLSVAASRALSLDPYTTRFFLLHLVVYAVFLAACLTFINNDGRLKKALLTIIIFGAGMAFFGILQRLANPDSIYGLRGTPQSIPFGPFVNQHHFAAFMEMTGGVTIGLLLGNRTARDKKILLAIALMIMCVAVVLTSSRGGMLSILSVAAFAALVNFFSGRWSKEKRSSREREGKIQNKVAIAAIAVGLVVVVFGTVVFLGGDSSLVRGIGMSDVPGGVSNGRSHFWAIAWQIFLEHPILGAGLEAFGVAFTKHDTWNGLFRVEQAHNEYLQMLADAGIAGFACVVAFIYFLFRRGLATISKAHGLRRDVAIGALAGCFGIMIHSFFDFPLRTPSNAFFFLLLAAIATVSIRSSHSDAKVRRRPTTVPSQ